MSHVCTECDRPMLLLETFLFDDERSDSPRMTAALQRLREMDIELGATVHLYYCAACDQATGIFSYPDPEITP